MIKWGLILALFLGLSLTIFYTGQSISLVGFEAGLLALNMSVGVLAINFSIMAYQNSEYRQFQQGLSPNFLAGLMLTLAWVMVPICCLVFNRSQVGLIALSSIPVTGLLSLVLVALAKKEGDASSLIHQLTDSKKWKRAFQKYGKNVAEQKKFWDQMGISIPDGMPTHEWSWTPLPPPLKTDPFALLGSIGCPNPPMLWWL